ncbi:MAG: hypothetical protein ACKPKO_62990, partial [Candidatus Fonsibacter sp.]
MYKSWGATWDKHIRLWSIVALRDLRQAIDMQLVQAPDAVLQDCLRTILMAQQFDALVRFYQRHALRPSQ